MITKTIGEGVKQDYYKVASLYQKSCDEGGAVGCYNLGFLYNDGKGVKQDFKVAKEHFGRACELGDQPGCDEYARLNEKGY